MSESTNLTRRQFATAALGAAAVLCTTGTAFADEEPAGFEIDTSFDPSEDDKQLVQMEDKVYGGEDGPNFLEDLLTFDGDGNPTGVKPEYDVAAADCDVRAASTEEPVFGMLSEGDVATNGRSRLEWMKDLPDDRPINLVNIPGTHDSAMANGDRGVTDMFALDQHLDIYDQLKIGCRFFDMRLNKPHDSDMAVNGHLMMCHGSDFFEARTSDNRDLYFHVFMDAIRDFLQAHPSEFVLIAPCREAGDVGYYQQHIEENLQRYCDFKSTNSHNSDKSFIYTGHSIPTVGEVRGCCVLLNRNALWKNMTTGPDWGIVVHLDNESANQVMQHEPPVTHHEGSCPSGSFPNYVARVDNDDEWGYDLEDKKRSTQQFIVNHTDRIPLEGEEPPASWTDLHIAYTSGYKREWHAMPPQIEGVAKYTNPFLNDYPWQKGYRYGWILSDFVGTNAGKNEFDPIHLIESNVFEGDEVRTGRYISDLRIGIDGNRQTALSSIENAGFRVLGNVVDCNESKGGRYIYLGYKTTDNPDEAIRDILATNDHNKSNRTFGGMQYEWVDSNQGRPIDMNTGAGGNYVYLATTKDKRAGGPITDVANYINWWGSRPEDSVLEADGWLTARWCNDRSHKGCPADMMNGTGSRNYIFVRFRRAADEAVQETRASNPLIRWLRQLFGLDD